MTSGLFITFEGVDGAGKSTQIALTARWLRERGYRVVVSREPGGTPLGEAVRNILLDCRWKDMHVLTELFLYAAARAQHVQRVILPALSRGEVVLCERYADSTVAYQAFAGGLDLYTVMRINDIATGCLEPHLTILLDLDPEVGLVRKQHASRLDRIERQSEEYRRKVREGYLWLANMAGKRVVVVDAHQDTSAVHRVVRSAVSCLLEEGKKSGSGDEAGTGDSPR